MKVLLFLHILGADAFWRMRCGVIQTGRVDPVISPGSVSGHVHTISGPSNFNTTSTYNSLRQSFCTSCQVQQDKSAYWTPQLYYQRKEGSFVPVRNDGTIVYYLGRGDNRASTIPFPAGFKMVSGDPFVRSYDNTTMTYKNGRPVADRVSFNCLQRNYAPLPETPSMVKTDCPNGLRAQIQFQSCWDGVNLYKSDQSHVAYMSQIDNGVCPPTHPKVLPHLFYEVYYWPNEIDTSDGGRFVFANGDATGFGFHGDFLNGWNIAVLQAGIKQCLNSVESGLISDCPPLMTSNDDYFDQNCPEQQPIVNEQVKGVLAKLPGCNPPSLGPARASSSCNQTKPALNVRTSTDGMKREVPSINATRDGMTYRGCFVDNTNGRALGSASYADDEMTLELCASFCLSKGLFVFGTEYARECWCGTSIPSLRRNQSECAMACKGNLTEYCGSGDRLSVWSLGRDAIKSNPTNVSVISATQKASSTSSTKASTASSVSPSMSDAVYLGCYSDSSTRAISGSYSGDQNMTLEICRSLAQNNNYKYFGLEYAGECYAGNAITSSTINPASCNMACKGNRTQICGGSNALSVFQNSKFVQPSNKDVIVSGVTFIYQGCFIEGSNGRALGSSPSYSFTSTNMTIEMCTSTCNSKGFSYAGTEWGLECYCNSIGPVNGASNTTQTDCNMTCKGNMKQICGGSQRVSIFKTQNRKRKRY